MSTPLNSDAQNDNQERYSDAVDGISHEAENWNAADGQRIPVEVAENSEPVFTKICRKCSVQSETSGQFCPNCGAPYVSKSARSRISKKTLIIVISAVVLVLAVGGTVLGVADKNQKQTAADAVAEASASASQSAASKASSDAAKAKAKSDAEAAEKELRTTIVTAAEASILKDAKAREKDGTLDGPFSRASCTPLGGGSVDDLTALTGTFECIAVNKKDSDGTESGYVFATTINWSSGEYSWHLGR